MKWKDILEVFATAGIIGTLAAFVNMLLSKELNLWRKVRNFSAGVAMAILIGFILRNTTLTEFWKEIWIGVSGAFVSSFWPVLEGLVRKYIQRKADDVVHNDFP